MEILRRLKAQDGAALVFTIMVMLFVLVAGTALLSMSTGNYIRVKSNQSRQQVHYIAESGVNKALAWVQEQVASGIYGDYNYSTLPEPVGPEGQVMFKIQKNTLTNAYKVTSTGFIPWGTGQTIMNIISADIDAEPVTSFQYAVEGRSEIPFPVVDFANFKTESTKNDTLNVAVNDVVYLSGTFLKSINGQLGEINENVVILAEGKVTISKDLGSPGIPGKSVGIIALGDITISGNPRIYGVIYTCGEIKVAGKPTVYGSIVTGKGFSGETPSVIYCSDIVKNVVENCETGFVKGGLAEYKIVRWQEEDE